MLEPAHGTITSFGPTHFNYQPDTGFSGTDIVTYVLRDGHGLVVDGSGDGVGRHRRRRIADAETRSSTISWCIRGRSVGFTVADLLVNDSEPAGSADERWWRCRSRRPTGC